MLLQKLRIKIKIKKFFKYKYYWNPYVENIITMSIIIIYCFNSSMISYLECWKTDLDTKIHRYIEYFLNNNYLVCGGDKWISSGGLYSIYI